MRYIPERPGDDDILLPWGQYAGNVTDITTLVSRQTIFLPLFPRLTRAITTCTIRCEVVTPYAALGPVPFAEVAVFSAEFVLGGAHVVTLRGFTDVSATFAGAGVKDTVVVLTNALPGVRLFAAFCSRTTLTPFQLRAYLADPLLCGVATELVLLRPSTTPAATVVASSTSAPPRCVVKT